MSDFPAPYRVAVTLETLDSVINATQLPGATSEGLAEAMAELRRWLEAAGLMEIEREEHETASH